MPASSATTCAKRVAAREAVASRARVPAEACPDLSIKRLYSPSRDRGHPRTSSSRAFYHSIQRLFLLSAYCQGGPR
jgi:hypothetical protein